jgi:hypothetical protein
MAHCFVLSLATVGSGAFEALVPEFLKDDQQEFYFSRRKKKHGRGKEQLSAEDNRSEGPAFETKR